MSDKSVTPIQARLYGDRTIRIYFQRKDWADFYEFTDQQMQQAAKDIESTFNYMTAGMGYGTLDLSMPGQSHNYEGKTQQDYWADMCQRYNEWSKNVESRTKGICLDVCVHAITYKDIAEQRAISPQTVMRRLQDGLGTYAYLQGWRANEFA